MTTIRKEADEAIAENEELKVKLKALSDEQYKKENEITSLSHRNQVLEKEVDKLEEDVKKHKGLADESTQHGTTAENLTRRLQVLEEEAETADRTLRETNEK